MRSHGAPPAVRRAYDVPAAAKDDNCAACERGAGDGCALRLGMVQGISMMLCTNALACTRHYRAGRTPAAYAKLVREGDKP